VAISQVTQTQSLRGPQARGNLAGHASHCFDRADRVRAAAGASRKLSRMGTKRSAFCSTRLI
jgi:hypothetical protein